MPIHTGQDKDGQFYQWGKIGKKYYYDPDDKGSKQRALNKAKKQQTAIYSTGWKGDAMKLIRVRKKDTNEQNAIGKIDEAKKKINESIHELSGQSDYTEQIKKLRDAFNSLTNIAQDIKKKTTPKPEPKQYKPE